MTSDIGAIVAPLFVPATRLDRLAKAAGSGADALIVDLEDAVKPADKAQARHALGKVSFPNLPIILRINASDTEWFLEDAKAAAGLNLAAVMLPKTETAAQAEQLGRALHGQMDIIALVETVRGIANLTEICAAPEVSRLAFGSVDFAADLGCAHERDSLAHARAQIVFGSRLADLAAPLDGVTLSVADPDIAQEDARHAANLGFGGKLCIHPAQIVPVTVGFAPSESEVGWAHRVLEAGTGGATRVDGMMVDAPVTRRAEQILSRATLGRNTIKGSAQHV